MQRFTVPTTSLYTILADGAQGGSGAYGATTGGLGAQVCGDFYLKQGDQLFIYVGGQGGGGATVGGTCVDGGHPPVHVVAGGGGSYDAGLNPVLTGGMHAGNGLVTIEPTTPEPSTPVMAGTAALLAGAWRRRRRLPA